MPEVSERCSVACGRLKPTVGKPSAPIFEDLPRGRRGLGAHRPAPLLNQLSRLSTITATWRHPTLIGTPLDSTSPARYTRRCTMSWWWSHHSTRARPRGSGLGCVSSRQGPTGRPTAARIGRSLVHQPPAERQLPIDRVHAGAAPTDRNPQGHIHHLHRLRQQSRGPVSD